MWSGLSAKRVTNQNQSCVESCSEKVCTPYGRIQCHTAVHSEHEENERQAIVDYRIYYAMCTPIGLRLQTYVSAKITCWVDHLYVE